MLFIPSFPDQVSWWNLQNIIGLYLGLTLASALDCQRDVGVSVCKVFISILISSPHMFVKRPNNLICIVKLEIYAPHIELEFNYMLYVFHCPPTCDRIVNLIVQNKFNFQIYILEWPDPDGFLFVSIHCRPTNSNEGLMDAESSWIQQHKRIILKGGWRRDSGGDIIGDNSKSCTELAKRIFCNKSKVSN